jgi:hypothetical protein
MWHGKNYRIVSICRNVFNLKKHTVIGDRHEGPSPPPSLSYLAHESSPSLEMQARGVGGVMTLHLAFRRRGLVGGISLHHSKCEWEDCCCHENLHLTFRVRVMNGIDKKAKNIFKSVFLTN